MAATERSEMTLGSVLLTIGIYALVIGTVGLWSERAYGPIEARYSLHLVWKKEAAYVYGQRFLNRHYCTTFGESFIRGFKFHGDPGDHPHMDFVCIKYEESNNDE